MDVAEVAFRATLMGCFKKGNKKKLPIVSVTDCKSLFDSVHRVGGPRAPSEKRLLVDLAGLRQMIKEKRRSMDGPNGRRRRLERP